MNEKTKQILNTVKDALGYHNEYFDIEEGEILIDEENDFSITFCFTPKDDLPIPSDHAIKAEKCYLQFDMRDDEINLMTGEDGDIELGVTCGGIYSQLYWNEVMEEI